MSQNMKSRTLRHRTLVLLLFLAALPGKDARAQKNFPARNIRQDERVTLDRSLPLKTALEILSQYSMRNDGKIIIDTQGKNPPINVSVNNMYWKRALEYILRSNLLKFEEKDRYYEVVPMLKSKNDSGENVVDTGTREIEINAIFFEADYATLAEAGIDWSVINKGKVKIFGNFAGSESKNDFTGEFKRSYRSYNVFAFLRALESMNQGEVIANPQIKVLDGQQGKIKVGQNFFLTTEDFAGNTRFQEYESGVILTVTPVIVGGPDSAFVHLTIRAERSNVIPDAQAVLKSITESTTQVLLLSGEETAIAGLFSNETNEIRRGFPILKDLPPWFFGLRYLFGFNSKTVKKKELIIILQANIMPTVAERIAARSASRKVYIDEKRQEFLQKMQQLKTLRKLRSRGGNGRSARRRR